MSKLAVRGIYNAALDGLGLVFKGSPENPAYSQRNASVFLNRYAQGDRSEGDFSLYWFWSQTDWAGGFQQEFHDVAYPNAFKSGNNIDPLKSLGKIQSLPQPQLVTGTISAGAAPSVVDTAVFGTMIVCGINKVSGTASFVTLTSADTFGSWSVPGGCGRSITQMDVFQQIYLYTGFSGAAAGSALVYTTTGGVSSCNNPAWNTFGTNPTTVRALTVIGADFYVGFVSTTAGEGDRIGRYSMGGTDWEAICQNLNPIMFGSFVNYKSTLYWLSQVGSKVELWSFSYDTPNKIYTWPSLQNPKISTFLSILKITGTNDGRIMEYSFDGASIDIIFEQLPFTSNIGVSETFEVEGRGYSDGMVSAYVDSEIQYFPSHNFLVNGTRACPIASFNDSLYLSNVLNSSGSLCIYKINPSTSTVYGTTSGSCSITSPLSTGQIPWVDKMYFDVFLRMDALRSGEKITVDYSTDSFTTDGSSTWTTLGSADFAIDGAANFKKIPFSMETPVISKQLKTRLTFTNGTATSARLQDLVVRYLPLSYFPHEWQIVVNASDEIELANGALDTKTGRQIRSQLQTAQWKNQLVDWQDIDYFSTRLTSALAVDGTVANVLDTTDAPENGRFIADLEEIFYSSKTPTSFCGLTRASRGTPAMTHGSGTFIDNAYKVLITDVSHRVPILARGTKVEYATTLTLRENI